MATLTVMIHDTPAALPAGLEARLAGAEPKSPKDLAAEIEEHAARSAKLRQAFLESVKDRAARETQRAHAAECQRRRLAASKVEKISKKREFAEKKSNAKREAAATEREERKAKRQAMALAVTEARAEASKARAARQAELAAMEATASAKHTKTVESVVSKSHWYVQHAAEVVAAHKEKEELAARTAADKLADKLDKAAARKDLAATSPDKSAAHHSPSVRGVRHRVLNDDKVLGETRRKLYQASMAKATAKRDEILQAVADKAAAENAKAAHIAAEAAAKANGTDASTMEAKVALFQKLQSADVLRQSAIKSRTLANVARKGGETVSVIVFKMHSELTLRMPPAALSLRLSIVNKGLLATASARQAGAAARRMALKNTALLKAAKTNQRRAAALARVGKARAANEAKVRANDARHMIHCALQKGKSLHGVAAAHERHLAATGRLTAAHTRRKQVGAAAEAKCKAAAERHSATLRKVAKTGVVAVRAAAFKSRREAHDAAVLATGIRLRQRCAMATAKRAEVLAERVAIAKKRLVAMHPKREVADMEIKPEA